MKIKQNIATSETGFIFNPATGDSFSANAIASEIILAVKKGISDGDIKKNILERYEVPVAQLDRDWDDLIHQLKAGDLLEL